MCNCIQTKNNIVQYQPFPTNNNYILYELLSLFEAYDELVTDVFLSRSEHENLKPVFNSLYDQVNDLITSLM